MIMDRGEVLELRALFGGNPVVGGVVQELRTFLGATPGGELRVRVAFSFHRDYGELTERERDGVVAWFVPVGDCEACEVDDHTACEPTWCDCRCNDVVQLFQPLGARSWASDGLRSAAANGPTWGEQVSVLMNKAHDVYFGGVR